jgi:hypothetical protein
MGSANMEPACVEKAKNVVMTSMNVPIINQYSTNKFAETAVVRR